MVSEPESARAYVEEAQVLLLRLDETWRIRQANPYARRRLGEPLIGRPLADLLVEFVDAGDLGSAVGDLQPRLLSLKGSAGGPESFLFRFYPVPEGVLALGALDVEEQDRLRREVLGLNRELNEMTRQLHVANAELRDMNALKDRFLGMVAHDLRQPLGLLITYLEILVSEGRFPDAESRAFLQTCSEAAHGMARRVEDFLDVAMISAGRFTLAPVPIACDALLAGVMVLVRALADRKGVRLYVENQAGDTMVHVDGPKLQQVLVSLISHAIAVSLPGQQVQVELWQREGRLEMVVRDQGPGLQPEELAGLFTTLVHAGTRPDAEARSFGLSLAIARRVVEAHGGRIWADSRPGLGLSLAFAVPLDGGNRA